MGGTVVELKFHVYAQRFLPHLLDKLGIGPCIGSGSAPGKLNGKGGRIAAKAGFFHTLDEQSLNVGIFVLQLAYNVAGSFAEVDGAYVALFGDKAGSRGASAAGDDFSHGFAVKRQRECQTDLLIGEHGILTVENDNERAGSTLLFAVKAAVGRELVDVIDIRNVDVVQRTILKGGHLGVHIFHYVGSVFGQLYSIGLPILIVLLEHEGAAVVPFLQNKGTAADDLIGICAVLVAVLFNVILAAGENIGVGKETGVRAVKGNYKGLVIGSSNTKGAHVRIAAEYIFKTNNAEHIGSKRPRVGGIGLTLESIEIVSGNNGLTIAPLVIPKMECIGKTIFRNFPSFCACTGNNAVLYAGKRLKNVIHNAAAVSIKELCNVQRRRLAVEQHVKVAVSIGILNVSLLRCGLLGSGGFGSNSWLCRGLSCVILRLIAGAAYENGKHHKHRQHQREILFSSFHGFILSVFCLYDARFMGM